MHTTKIRVQSEPKLVPEGQYKVTITEVLTPFQSKVKNGVFVLPLKFVFHDFNERTGIVCLGGFLEAITLLEKLAPILVGKTVEVKAKTTFADDQEVNIYRLLTDSVK